ncbi:BIFUNCTIONAL INHIBITOR/LIPID-TRANSFER PROTEIN/SEED STORAGE 2S ALBUMIN SUPERFAMILY PROTEIN [Salix purpurea]|uniref:BIFUNCTIONAL INHIBITOR/LIPID-TRANSFER PROTEIN/SEED STORAGE 2S ALBUMIN SUPERFAMILY PROTEIN n=1 Tax=Salix purpurea TaxID=77065 RepID=A0A9Q0TGW4_SALPP|nr:BIFUNCTIONAL INHIBITOR/LIPID-TRANSFER PROTEIN/SEED STORAGE 2S ALBUMIN SUPERFAMILY PROTEIN [Salix purpurea]
MVSRKTVLSTKAECLCEAFKSSDQYGIVLNVTRAISLPSACKIHAPAASNCGSAISPSGAPAPAPGGSTASAPPPSSGQSGSNGIFHLCWITDHRVRSCIFL